MSRYPGINLRQTSSPYVSSGVVASFMNMVYAWMCVGLACTAITAAWVAGSPEALRAIFSGPTPIILFVIEIGLVIVISSAINKISPAVATGLFIVFSIVNGLTLSAILIVYTAQSIGVTFAATAGMFGAMSLIGFTTKKDLTSLGGFLMMALIGLIIASLANWWFKSSALAWVITYAGILIFLGLTAYDTQKLKGLAIQTEGNARLAARLAIVGSLTLYLDFINLFLMMLRLLGSRRD